MSTWRSALGQAVRARRQQLGLTLAEASTAIGISRSHLNLIELGKATGISRESVAKIEAGLDCVGTLLPLLDVRTTDADATARSHQVQRAEFNRAVLALAASLLIGAVAQGWPGLQRCPEGASSAVARPVTFNPSPTCHGVMVQELHRVLVTGAAGRLGTLLRQGLRGRVGVLRLLDIASLGTAQPGEELRTTDVRDLAAMTRAAADVDAVVHLAGIPDEDTFEHILDVNMVGTYHAFEAARRQHCQRVVLASSAHVTGFYPTSQRIGPEVPPRPDSFYGVSKAFGENLGRLYADKHGLEVVCVRIGTLADCPTAPRHLSTWLSPRDAVELFYRCLVAPRSGSPWCTACPPTPAAGGTPAQPSGWATSQPTPPSSGPPKSTPRPKVPTTGCKAARIHGEGSERVSPIATAPPQPSRLRRALLAAEYRHGHPGTSTSSTYSQTCCSASSTPPHNPETRVTSFQEPTGRIAGSRQPTDRRHLRWWTSWIPKSA